MNKFREYEELVIGTTIDLHSLDLPLIELQDINSEKIVREKTMDAYKKIGRPLFVEHSSFQIDYLNSFPGGLTSHFLDTVGEKKICNLFGAPDRNAASGMTNIGYCDGKTVHTFQGQIAGYIAPAPAGDDDEWSKFGWNRIFIPEGYSKSLSELGIAEKNKFSMRRVAMNKLLKYLGVK